MFLSNLPNAGRDCYLPVVGWFFDWLAFLVNWCNTPDFVAAREIAFQDGHIYKVTQYVGDHRGCLLDVFGSYAMYITCLSNLQSADVFGYITMSDWWDVHSLGCDGLQKVCEL